MSSAHAPVLLLLRAIEGAMREGLLLDEAIGGILDAALRVQEAAAVGLLPAGGSPPLTRAGSSLIAVAAEQRLAQHLSEVLTSGRPSRMTDSGISFFGAPVSVTDQVRGAFGTALGSGAASQPEAEEMVRSFARIFGHVLERDRTLAALVKRREEAVALFELASGALHSLHADDVVRMTTASLARELDLDVVTAYRFDPESREVEEIHRHDARHREAAPPTLGRRPIASEEILARCLAQNAPVFEDEETASGKARRRKLAIPIATPDTVFGFLVATRRGSLSLAPQQMRLAEGLSRIAAGALEKGRLLEKEQRESERMTFLSRLQKAIAGAADPSQIGKVAVAEVAARFGLDLCAVRLLPSGELPAGAATFARPEGGIVPGDGVPEALVKRLSAPGTWVSLPDVLADPDGASLAPAPAALRRLSRPIGLVGVPILAQGEVCGVLAGVIGGRPNGFDPGLVSAFESVASEIGHALEATRALFRERESARFLDRLREAQRAMTTTFDAARIRLTLAEQAVSLLKVDSALVWEADAEKKAFVVSSRSGPAFGIDVGAAVPAASEDHPVAVSLRKGTLMVLADEQVGTLHPDLKAGTGARAAITPLMYGDQPAGAISIASRHASGAAEETVARLALLADVGAIALHNARTMKLLETQTERDPLTGLYRRDAILRRLDAEIRRAERTGRAVAIANLRLEGLADAIQRMGPSFGDTLLPKASAQIVHVTRAGNLVGRDRNDRFLIVLFDCTRAQAHKAAEAIQRNFDRNFEPRLTGSDIKFVLTFGLAAYPEDAFDAPSLVLRAEEALDDAVRAGPGSVVLYGALSDAEESGPTM